MRPILAILATFAILATSCGGAATPQPTASPTAQATTQATAKPTATVAPSWSPTNDVELVVQASAGGGSDIFARKIADVLVKQKIVAKPINVVNKPGGSGAVAYSYIKQKQGDPHFLATVTLSYLTTPLQQDAGYTYKDLSNLVTLATDDFVAVVKADAPYKDLKDLVAAAKAKPSQVKVGGTQVGSSDSIIPALIEKAAGVKFTYVTFKSGGDVNAALLGGSVDYSISNPGEASELIKGGKLRAIAAFSPQRLTGYDVPTAKEQGIDVQWEQFRGIVAPGGLTAEQRAYWSNAFMQMTKTTDWAGYLTDNTLRPLVKSGPDVDKYLDDQTNSLRTVLKDLGVIK